MGEVWPTAHITELCLQLPAGSRPVNGDEHRALRSQSCERALLTMGDFTSFFTIRDMCLCTQWFGYYKPGQTSVMYTMQESALYTEVTRLSLFAVLSGFRGKHTLRSAGTNRLLVPPVRLSTVCNRAFTVAGPRVWNTLPEDITTSQSLSVFCQRLKTWLFRKSYPDIII